MSVATDTHAGPLPGAFPEVTTHRVRTVAIIAGALLVAAAAVFFIVRSRSSSAALQPRLETVKVTRGALRARVTATGTLSAVVTVQVGSQVSGRIQEILVDFNSPVKKGQLLARIDPLLFTAALEQARALELSAEANLEKAQAQAFDAAGQYRRAIALAKRQVIGSAELEAAQANARSAKAQISGQRALLAQAHAARHQAETNLTYTEILSPIDGMVISRNVDVGQTVAASFQSPVLFVLAEDLKKMQVDTAVAEADVGRLRPGMTARFSVDAYASETFDGQVRQIRNAPQTLQNVVTYDAVIDVANPGLKLRPGMTANATFVYAERDDALLVANAALRFRPPPAMAATARQAQAARGDRRLVWRRSGAEARPVEIRLGVSDGLVTEVLEGDLRPGDEVVTEAQGPKNAGAGSFGRMF